MVRIPGYAGQSSDSEASISVMRRVREEHRLRKNIISDTEVLGDLGLNNVTMAALEDMLSSDLLKIAQYSSTTATAGCGSPSPTTRAPSTSSTSGPTPMTVTVRGGFERELICVGGH
ncbi:hypothetical protein BGW38_010215 [Lunasporangiospora selenospora]|uniref:Uncharacterized protein n=1 Tax=Lunasporangiospora selenospora TaxID=979761 RepID=A0A9P6EUF9_9FUNG|nr:hypothetical protein BGW38_010215 [Lunasporangiospora selenospora]